MAQGYARLEHRLPLPRAALWERLVRAEPAPGSGGMAALDSASYRPGGLGMNANDVSCPAVARQARPTGWPPVCRWCGAVIHRASRHGGAVERCCRRCQSWDGRARRGVIPLLAWAQGWPIGPALDDCQEVTHG
jgi:hypothetical protein